ncbi:hypothetical protein GGX14DRAFT_397871 [Mycena pura]|uniref:Uncharacterized protein n=1 Tax=Mycena pura TaxID=153505 RepID=A0AAD6Y893_9AGAR|nr:hypothetical protein GGX14DRAFT_397871 [Mycena pura]
MLPGVGLRCTWAPAGLFSWNCQLATSGYSPVSQVLAPAGSRADIIIHPHRPFTFWDIARPDLLLLNGGTTAGRWWFGFGRGAGVRVCSSAPPSPHRCFLPASPLPSFEPSWPSLKLSWPSLKSDLSLFLHFGAPRPHKPRMNPWLQVYHIKCSLRAQPQVPSSRSQPQVSSLLNLRACPLHQMLANPKKSPETFADWGLRRLGPWPTGALVLTIKPRITRPSSLIPSLPPPIFALPIARAASWMPWRSLLPVYLFGVKLRKAADLRPAKQLLPSPPPSWPPCQLELESGHLLRQLGTG